MSLEREFQELTAPSFNTKPDFLRMKFLGPPKDIPVVGQPQARRDRVSRSAAAP